MKYYLSNKDVKCLNFRDPNLLIIGPIYKEAVRDLWPNLPQITKDL